MNYEMPLNLADLPHQNAIMFIEKRGILKRKFVWKNICWRTFY